MSVFPYRSIKIHLSGVFLILFTLLSTYTKAQDGEKLFKSYCSSCHYPSEKQLVGPGLKGVKERLGMPWIIKWVTNSQALVKSGDKDAVDVFEKFNKIVMPPQPVKPDEIKAIFTFIESQGKESGGATAKAGAEPAANTAATAKKADDSSTYIIFIVAIILLLTIIAILRKVNYSLQTAAIQKEGGEEIEEKTMLQSLKEWVSNNKRIVALLLLGLLILIAKAGWNAALNIGVYEGYQPEQPIKFSHKLHAGINKINCNYCHSGARNSRTAGIPTANVCMNCHTYIDEGPQYGKEEIAKIYKALDFDPVTKTYGPNKTPIKWVKVHNLPDFVYFNHSQHVTVGGIACQKCHGPVETFTVGKQFAPLTMGWCINCHRETKVQMKGNGYYDEIHKRLPEDLKEKYLKDGVITVAELGGIECGKCHY